MRKKNNKNYKILIIIGTILIIVCVFVLGLEHFGFRKSIFIKPKNISEIISELPRRYQTDIDISGENGVIKGNMIREENRVIFEIKEPVLLSGFQVIYDYDNKKIFMKYKEIESKLNYNLVIKNLPISIVINIENLIYQGCCENWNVEDDILYLEGKYEDDEFIVKIDLRQNRIVSISLKNTNIGANIACD